MKDLDRLEVTTKRGSRPVILCSGDVASPTEPVDLLVVSAGSDHAIHADGVSRALSKKGVVLAELARTRASEINDEHSVGWLSGPVRDRGGRGFRYDRVFCFEARMYTSPEDAVRQMFRSLAGTLQRLENIRSAVMPVVFTGEEGLPHDAVLQSVVRHAANWLHSGDISLEEIRIVVLPEREASARKVFWETADQLRYRMGGVHVQPENDVFVSYARANRIEADRFVEYLTDAEPSIRVFVDRRQLTVGATWLLELYENLDSSRRVVALISPHYVDSEMCIDEFLRAKLRGAGAAGPVLYPICLYKTIMPSHMRAIQLDDSIEGDREALRRIAADVARQVESEREAEPRV